MFNELRLRLARWLTHDILGAYVLDLRAPPEKCPCIFIGGIGFERMLQTYNGTVLKSPEEPFDEMAYLQGVISEMAGERPRAWWLNKVATDKLVLAA